MENIVHQFRLDEFKTFFRVGRPTVQVLQDYIVEMCREENVPGITERRGSGGSPQKPLNERILMVLWYMASLDKFASLADRFGMSESTACDAVHELIQFIHQYLLNKVVTWPSAQEQQEMKEMYFDLKKFPGVVGMLDGTHIQIRRPAERGFDYYNRKEYYSVVLQAVVREDLCFTNVYTGWPGKVHDARVFRNSPLSDEGAALCGDGHILGDSAYPNLSFLLTPFRNNGHLTADQKRYNAVHASIRVNVERAFGILKGRFVRLQNIQQAKMETIIPTILTGCILHNICLMNSDGFDAVLQDNPVPQPRANPRNYDGAAQLAAAQKRLAIARALHR